MHEVPHLREAQKKLAEEVVLMVHGEQALQRAINVTEALFSGSFSTLDEASLEMLSKTLPQTKSNALMDALIDLGLAQSKREAREFMNNGAITLNGEKVPTSEYELVDNDFLANTYAIVRRGKKKYGMIIK